MLLYGNAYVSVRDLCLWYKRGAFMRTRIQEATLYGKPRYMNRQNWLMGDYECKDMEPCATKTAL